MRLGDRVKQILVSPATEWPVIRAEPMDMRQVFRQVVLPLAAIPAVAGFIGGSLVGMSVFGVHYRVGLVPGIMSALVGFGLSLVSVYVLAMIVDALAPTFGSRRGTVPAYKLAAYAHIPSWLAGVFLLLPGLRVFTLLGLYGFYLFYIGLPPIMGTPEDKRLSYTLAVLVISIVVMVVAGLVLRSAVPYA